MDKNIDPSKHPIDYEERSIPLRRISLWVVGLFLFLAAAEAAVFFLYGTPRSKPVPQVVENRPMNQPVLHADPAKHMAAFLKEQNKHLSTYGWVNKAQGIVRLPIERAIELTLERGLPARGGKQP